MKILKKVFLSICLCGVGTIIFFYSTDWLWPEFNGSHNLGNNIYMIEWDGGPIVVQGSNIRGRTCYGGSPVVPSYESNINRREYVVYSKYNDSWILIKTVMHNPVEDKYYIINKTFEVDENPQVIQTKYTKSFSDSISFVGYLQSHNIQEKYLKICQ